MSDEIIPTKFIVNKTELKTDDTATRQGYDSRLLAHTELPPEFSHYRLFDFFNVELGDRQNNTKNEQLKQIAEWAITKATDKDTLGMIRTLSDLDLRLGSRTGEDRLTKLYRYIKLDSMVSRLENERDMQYRGI